MAAANCDEAQKISVVAAVAGWENRTEKMFLLYSRLALTRVQLNSMARHRAVTPV